MDEVQRDLQHTTAEINRLLSIIDQLPVGDAERTWHQQRVITLQQNKTALLQKEVALLQQSPAAIDDGVAVAIARRVKEELTPLYQEMHDDIRSWHSSQVIEASKVSSHSMFLLRRLLRVACMPADAADAQAVMAADAAADPDFTWDDTPEPSQRAEYMAQIMANVGDAYTNRSITWKQQVTTRLVVKGLGHQVVARSDELIIARRFLSDPPGGAIMGIELKKRLSPASRRQGEAEFYTFSLCSNFPFVQVVTDMQRGGFAYWQEGEQDGQQVVVERALVGMGAVYDFIKAAFRALPWNIGQDEGQRVVMPPQLSDPVRCRLKDPVAYGGGGGPQLCVEVGDDALDELHPWFDMDKLHVWDGADAKAFPSYIV